MADVFQIVPHGKGRDDSNFEAGIVDANEWHAMIVIDDRRTLCGIQLACEDGYAAGPARKGRVTCAVCRAVLEQVQVIKGWR